MTAAHDLATAIDEFAQTVFALGITAVLVGVVLVMVYLVVRGALR